MEDVAQTIFLVSFLRKRKSVYSSFQREIPCSRPLTVFFRQKTPLLTKVQWISMQDVAQIGFFFTKKNLIYSSFQRQIPCCRLGKSSTPLVLITHSIFFSFPPLLLRLREVDFIGCYETVDQQTAELRNLQNSVNMQICSRWALGEI